MTPSFGVQATKWGHAPIAVAPGFEEAVSSRKETYVEWIDRVRSRRLARFSGFPRSGGATGNAARSEVGRRTRHRSDSHPLPRRCPVRRFAGRYTMMEELRSQEEEANRLLDGVVVAAGLESAERHTVVGVPAERLADLADEEQAELIVVGSRGRGAFKSAFLGSVSNSLIGVARCPVLVVPPGATMRS